MIKGPEAILARLKELDDLKREHPNDYSKKYEEIEKTLTVALDSEITEELKLEGYVRDLVRGIQNLRKESGLEVTDRITLTLSGDSELNKAYSNFADYISNETLADKIDWIEKPSSDFTSIEADDKTWSAKLEKV